MRLKGAGYIECDHLMAKKRWVVKNSTVDARSLGRKYNLDPIVVQLLINREIEETDFVSFLNPQVM